MGRVTDPSAAASVAVFSTLEAGEAIKSGDLLVQASDAKAYWATDPAVPATGSRPLYQAADAYFSQPNTTVSILGQANSLYEAIGCSTVYFDDGSFLLATLNNDVGFAIFKPDGSVLTPRTSLGAYVTPSQGYYAIATKKLPNGNAIVVFVGANSRPCFAVISPKGVIVKAVTQLDTVAAYTLSIALLANGNIAAAYSFTTSPNYGHKLVVFGADGTLIKGPIVIATGVPGLTPLSVAVSPAADGTFAVAWHASGCWFQTFSAAGDGQGSSVQFWSGTAAQQRLVLIPLTGGGYGLGHCPDSGNSLSGYLYNFSAAGAMLKRNDMTGLANQSVGYHAFDICPMSDGGMSAIWCWNENNTSYLGVARLSATGTSIVAPSKAVFQPSPYPGANGQMFRIAQAIDGSGNILASWINSNQSCITMFDGNFGIIKSLNFIASPTGGLGAPFINQIVDPLNANVIDVAMMSCPYGTGNPIALAQFLLSTKAKIPVGVAIADTAKGDRVKFMTVGSTPTRLSFTKPFSADYSASLGQKMSLVGNTAILKGIQP